MITTYANIGELPENTSVCIYGLGGRGQLIKDKILETRKDIKIVCFIDDYKSVPNVAIPSFSSDTFLTCHLEFDYIILSSIYYGQLYKKVGHLQCAIVGLPFFIRDSDKLNQEEIQSLQDEITYFKNYLHPDDIELYEAILAARLDANNLKSIVAHQKKNIEQNKEQYTEFLRREKIKTMIEGGVFDGLSILNFLKCFPELKKIYGFEAFYEMFQNGVHSAEVLRSEKVEILQYALWDRPCQLFLKKNPNLPSASTVSEEENTDDLILEATAIDDFLSTHVPCPKIDFIKLDVEGAEQKVLAGAIKTIQKDRPQLAISIYHSKEDFIQIPVWLIKHCPNYTFRLGHYSPEIYETVLYAIPNELV